MKRRLDKFFNPKVVAVIGASEHPEKVGGILVGKLKDFDGKVVLVNPKHEEIAGIKCYKSILDYDGKIDLAVIATRAETVEKILKECAKKKIENVIVISAGFSEVKNFEAEKKIVSIAKKHAINLLGPNCFGIENPYLKLDTTFSTSSVQEGDVAFVSQSGALWSYISDLGLGFSGFVSLGNMADLEFSDWIEYFSKDDKTKKIVLYIEKIKDGRKFIEVCKNSSKEIVAVKAGRTEQGSIAAVSHTGSIATDYEIYRGAFAQAGVKIVESLGEAFGIKVEEFSVKNEKVIIITNAGGAGSLIADKVVNNKNKLVEQPIDILGTATAQDYKKEIEKWERKNFDGKIIIAFTPQKMGDAEEIAKVIVNSKLKKNMIAFFLGDKSVRKANEFLRKNGVEVVGRI